MRPWHGRHSRANFPAVVKRCLDKIAGLPMVIKAVSKPYRRQMVSTNKGASLHVVKPGEVQLTIKDEGVFPFFIHVVKDKTEVIRRDIITILTKEGLAVASGKQDVSRAKLPLFEQASWLKASVARFKTEVADVCQAIADEYNNRFRKGDDSIVTASVIQNRLRAFHISLAPIDNGETPQKPALTPGPVLWTSLSKQEQQGYRALRASAVLAPDGSLTVKGPTVVISQAMSPEAGRDVYTRLKKKGVIIMITPSRGTLPSLQRIQSIEMPPQDQPDGQSTPPTILTRTEPVASWEALTAHQQQAYRTLTEQAIEVTDDGCWLLRGGSAILGKAFGRGAGSGLYKALLHKGVITKLEPARGSLPGLQKLVDLNMPAGEVVVARSSKNQGKPQLSTEGPANEELSHIRGHEILRQRATMEGGNLVIMAPWRVLRETVADEKEAHRLYSALKKRDLLKVVAGYEHRWPKLQLLVPLKAGQRIASKKPKALATEPTQTTGLAKVPGSPVFYQDLAVMIGNMQETISRTVRSALKEHLLVQPPRIESVADMADGLVNLIKHQRSELEMSLKIFKLFEKFMSLNQQIECRQQLTGLHSVLTAALKEEDDNEKF